MRLYRVTAIDYGHYGPRGMTMAGTGLSTWAFTDKAQATRRYATELKRAVKEKRRASLRLQLLTTPDRMTTEAWIQSIVLGEVPYEITRTLKADKTDPKNLELAA